jgi:sugar phosphate isomerase/epimerase
MHLMKFAFSTNAFRHFSLADSIRIVADAGYQGVEIMADVPHAFPLHLGPDDILDIRRTLDRCRLEISNINAFMHHADGDTYHPSWIENDPALRAKRVDYTLRCIDLAAELGARNLSTEPGGPLQDLTRDEGLRLFRDGLRQIEERARARNILILIEPEPGLLIENSQQFLELFRDLDPAVFGLNFDIGHFFCVGEDPAARVRELQAATHHFHLEDIAVSREHHHLMLGEGAIDIPHVLDTIRGTGFDGFVTVELYTYEDQPIEATRRAMNYLQAWQGSE